MYKYMYLICISVLPIWIYLSLKSSVNYLKLNDYSKSFHIIPIQIVYFVYYLLLYMNIKYNK